MSKFQPGQSGNPGGRPKVLAEVKQLAREYTAEAISALADIVKDKKAPPAARVGAAQVILDRGYGKPTQYVEASVSVLDNLSLEQQRALLAALDAIEGAADGAAQAPNGTAH
jgi:hypothetical protein